MFYLWAPSPVLGGMLVLGLSTCTEADSPEGKPSTLLTLADDMG